MKVLVTGASGFLGSHIAEQLAAEGNQVRLLLRTRSSRRFLSGFPYEEACGDVTDIRSLPPALEGIDAIVHAAALVKARGPSEFEAVNAQGTANLLTAADQAGCSVQRFVYVSTLAAHGPSADGKPRQPEDAPRPITSYGVSKLRGEELVRAWRGGDFSVIVRPPVVYGPRDSGLLPFFQLARRRIAPLLMGGHNRISIIYAEDAARAIARAATTNSNISGMTYFLDDGETYSWRDLLSAVEQAVERRAIRISSPRWIFSVAALLSEGFGFVSRRAVHLTREKVLEMGQPFWICSSQQIQHDLGWAPRVGINEGARLTAEWYRRQGWL